MIKKHPVCDLYERSGVWMNGRGGAALDPHRSTNTLCVCHVTSTSVRCTSPGAPPYRKEKYPMTPVQFSKFSFVYSLFLLINSMILPL
jgi:hypothetical protein